VEPFFLDEIGDMPLAAQAQDPSAASRSRRFERVGGNQSITTQVRVLAATNQDLESLIAGGAVFEQTSTIGSKRLTIRGTAASRAD